ncbi:aspartic peptidase domain-containing protein [Mycena maculata]|uniref:Aspartic peptidase domain-containing protein n=1 Tax=Mycena maculata TaxID=230809 RepID=A0AAD7NA48_9AGAR|nr:aspartic peptidase domain-containing protein [Mycena maculata]
MRAPLFALVATFIIALSSGKASLVKRDSTGGMLTFGIRRVEMNQHLHPNVLLHRELKRAERTSGSTALHSAEVVSDNGDDNAFLATVPIGTPPRNFSMTIDSGSISDFFWVESSEECNTNNGGCGNHTILGGDNSRTFFNTNKAWSTKYGAGSASGDIIRDTIWLGGIELKNLTFGLAHSINPSFSGRTLTDMMRDPLSIGGCTAIAMPDSSSLPAVLDEPKVPLQVRQVSTYTSTQSQTIQALPRETMASRLFPGTTVHKEWYTAPNVPHPWSTNWDNWEGLDLFHLSIDGKLMIDKLFKEVYDVPGPIEPLAYMISIGYEVCVFAAAGRYYWYNDGALLVFVDDFSSPQHFLEEVLPNQIIPPLTKVQPRPGSNLGWLANCYSEMTI